MRSQALAPVLRIPPEGVRLSVYQLEAALGGRPAIVAALAHAPGSRDLAYLLGLIGDPRNDGRPLADLCAEGGITPGELIAAYKAGELARAQAVATAKVGGKLAEVAEDTMQKALANTDFDVEYKKLALDLGKLLPKGGGLSVAVSQQLGVVVGSAGGALERLQAATDQILYGETLPGPREDEGIEAKGWATPAEAPPLETFVEGDWREAPAPEEGEEA